MAKKTTQKAKGKQLSVRLSDDVYDWIKGQADAENRSMAYVVDAIIRKQMSDTANERRVLNDDDD